MNGIKLWVQKFMIGRYGSDEFSRFLNTWILLLLIIGLFAPVVTIVGLFFLIYEFFRTFSKNHSKRYKENLVYLQIRNIFLKKINTAKCRITQRKTHCFYICPSCKKTVRIPRGKGKITITCPVCKTRFDRKS